MTTKQIIEPNKRVEITIMYDRCNAMYSDEVNNIITYDSSGYVYVKHLHTKLTKEYSTRELKKRVMILKNV